MIKRLSFLFFTTFLILSCSSRYDKLAQLTDKLVIEVYEGVGGGLFSVPAQHTEDGYYTVAPVGGRIIVKINEAVPGEDYEDLQRRLSKRYKGNKRVNEVYINRGGTVVIDCRH